MTLTPFQKHVNRWSSCTACPLWEGRQQVVLARGTLPCDVLFIGEAPGESEDVLGQPFVGPAGQLLDQIIQRAFAATQVPGTEGADYNSLTWAFTNLVCCIPRDEDGGKATEPDDEYIKACSVRLIEFVEIAEPRLIVCVGALARDWLTPGYRYSIKLHRDVPRIDIIHPAAVLRANIAHRGLMVQRAVVQISNAVEEL